MNKKNTIKYNILITVLSTVFIGGFILGFINKSKLYPIIGTIIFVVVMIFGSFKISDKN